MSSRKSKLNYEQFNLEDRVVFFDENLDIDQIENLTYFSESNWAEVSNELNEKVDYYVTNNHYSKIDHKKTKIFSVNKFLNYLDKKPESFDTFIEALIKENFDISIYSNEGDGLLDSINFATKQSDIKDALLELARQSEIVEKIILASKNRYNSNYEKENKYKNDEQIGWYKFVNPIDFAWDIRAFNDDTLVSGKSILDTLSKFATDISVLEIHDVPSHESIDAIHICGGFDENKNLIGFILHRVWT